MGQFGNEPLWYDVPPSQNLVIESISAFVGVPKGQNANLWLSVDYPKKDGSVTYYLPLIYQATYSSNPTNPSEPVRDWRTMDHVLRAYIPAGSRIFFMGMRNEASDAGSAGAVITGYLEP